MHTYYVLGWLLVLIIIIIKEIIKHGMSEIVLLRIVGILLMERIFVLKRVSTFLWKHKFKKLFHSYMYMNVSVGET